MTRLSFAVSDENAVRELLEDLEISESWETIENADDASTVWERDAHEPFQVLIEAAQLFHVALPSVLIQFSLFFIFPQSASAVGRTLGTVELGGFSLGSLVGNLTCLSIVEGALTAADTMMPRAFGAENYEEVGRIAVRGALVCLALLGPSVIPLCTMAGSVLKALGQDSEASQLAEEWIRFYFIGVPANLFFRIMMRFLLAQHKPWHLVFASTIPCMSIHPILLRYLVPTMGLPGSALAIAITQWFTAILLSVFLLIRPAHRPERWPGLSYRFVRESMHLRPLLNFLHLSVGGILSMNEWWCFEVLCFIAGSFGVVSLCVHTIAYNLVPLLFMIPLGISIGLAVRMGHVIAHNPYKAKLMAAWCMGFIVVIGAMVALLLHTFRYDIIHMFTKDDDVIRGALNI